MREDGHRWFASFYDRLSRSMERGTMGRMRPRLLEGIAGDVVEIGAGTGLNFPHYPPSARVIAFEPDPHMLRRAREHVTPGIDLRQAPGERIPLDDASADVVVSTLVLCTVDSQEQSLAEIRRVLRPGGELRFIEHVRSTGVFGRVQDISQPVWGQFSGGCHWNRRTEEAIAAAGFAFRTIEHTRLDGPMRAISGVAAPL